MFTGHPKCKGFLTHGGLLSTQEAVYHGVPVIGLPFVSDQENNMNKAVRDGYAIVLNWSDIDEEIVYNALNNLTSVPRYSLFEIKGHRFRNAIFLATGRTFFDCKHSLEINQKHR